MLNTGIRCMNMAVPVRLMLKPQRECAPNGTPNPGKTMPVRAGGVAPPSGSPMQGGNSVGERKARPARVCMAVIHRGVWLKDSRRTQMAYRAAKSIPQFCGKLPNSGYAR